MTQTRNAWTALRQWGRKSLWCGLVSGVILTGQGAFAPLGAKENEPAGSPSQPSGKMQFTKQQQFRLKIDLPEADRQKLKEVQLFVKNPDSKWVCHETAAPSQTHFNFRATQDGEYWFTIVTLDKSGRAAPADVTKEAPAFVVVVDSQFPDVQVTGPLATKGSQIIRCSVKDANADPTALKIEYQSNDKTWRALEPIPNQAELFRAPDRGTWTGQVKVTAGDLAKNVTVRQVALPTQSAAPAPEVATGPLPPLPGPASMTAPVPAAMAGAPTPTPPPAMPTQAILAATPIPLKSDSAKVSSPDPHLADRSPK